MAVSSASRTISAVAEILVFYTRVVSPYLLTRVDSNSIINITAKKGTSEKETAVLVNPFIPTFLLTVANISLPKRSEPYWSNPPFLNFLTFRHSGAQS